MSARDHVWPVTDDGLWTNFSVNDSGEDIYNSLEQFNEFYVPKRDPLSSVIPITVLYVIILVTGLVGNVCTCIVIHRNKHMHNSTNCYLFNLAISDLLLLLVGLPQEIYQLWNRYPYVFGEAFCLLRGLASETSTNVSILTITSFTVERYLAICHPLKAQATSSVRRAVKIIVAVWLIGGICAGPLAFQFGVVLRQYGDKFLEGTDECTLKRRIPHSFEISTCFFFILPIIAMCVLYVLIGLKLRHPDGKLRRILPQKEQGKAAVEPLQHPKLKRLFSRLSNRSLRSRGANSSREAAVKMLFAVVVAFFACWAPFHAQRLMALHLGQDPTEGEILAYTVLTYISGVTYFVSATINPILYSIMSVKFRKAFRNTLATGCCGKDDRNRHSARMVYTSTRSTIRYEYPVTDKDKFLVITQKNEAKYLTKVRHA